MSVVDDVRKVVQDLIAPDPQSLRAELKNVDEKSKLRDDALSAKVDAKTELLVSKIDALTTSLNIDRRVEAIERKVSGPM